MKLTVLGSGMSTHVPNTPFRYPASYLVEVDGQKILFDAGIGVTPQLAKLKVPLLDVRAICISHFHADHFAIAPLLQPYYLYARFGELAEKPSLHIFGPEGIEERVKTAWRDAEWSFDGDIMETLDLTFSSYKDGGVVQLTSNTKLTAFKTKHFALDAYALRLESSGKVLAYSGDTTFSPGLDKAAQDADLFLCEAARPHDSISDDGHLGPQGAAMVANKQNCKQLVLTHYLGKDTTEEMVSAVKKTGYLGDVRVADDLASFDV